MSMWSLYFWTRLDDINALLGAGLIFISIAMLGMILVGGGAEGSMSRTETQCYFKWWKRVLISAGIIVLLFTLTPTKKDVAIIVAGSFVTQSETTKELGETAKLGVKVLNEYLQSLDVKPKENK